tara:strand:+ start:525 stop:1550 length:1026 start_codon:yes stop_codon:yes gene_type:complete
MAKQYLPYTTGDTWGGLADWQETAGNLSQVVANQPKYWSVVDEVAQMGDMVPIAHAPLPQDVSALQRRGFSVDRAKTIPQLDDIARGTRMNQGVFVGAGDDASDIAKMYGKEKLLRGTKFGEAVVKPFTGMALRDAIQFSRNMYGHLQGKVPAGIANTAFGLPGVQDSGIIKVIPKSALTKFFARFLPGANVALGGASAASRFAKGQPVRAGMAAGSMIPGPIGMGFLGAETAADYIVSAAEKTKAAEEEAARRAATSKKEAIGGGAAGSGTGQQTQRRRQPGTQQQERKRKQRSRSRAAQRGRPSKRQQRSRSRAAQRRSRFARRSQGGIVSINDMIGSL